MQTILFEVSGDRTSAAVINSKRELQHISIESKHYIMEKNSIYNGKICSIRPEIGACFVRYDNGKKDGFLPFDNISPHYTKTKESIEDPVELAKKLKVGQKILVQIKKDQRGHESKGAALTTYISLAGTYLVILPFNNKQGVSRKADTQQRDQIKELVAKLELPEDFGIIIRTAGINRTLDELKSDYLALVKQWDFIQQQSASSATPSLVHEEDNIIWRTIRDYPSTEIVVDNEEIYESIQSYPTTENRNVSLWDKDMPLYAHYSIHQQIEKIYSKEIKLPSGGSIIAQCVEAGCMIDVNSGRSTSGANIEETALSTNLEAAVAAANILKLRDTPGIIIIDFIDMSNSQDQKKVEQAFAEAISHDRAKIKFEPISEMNGVMNVLRQGLGYPFFASSMISIDNDETIVIGKKRSIESYSHHILNIIESSAYHNCDEIQIQIPQDVAVFLLNEERTRIADFEKRYDVNIKIIPNITFKGARYTLKRFRHDNDNESTQKEKSYELIIDQKSTDLPWPNVTQNKKKTTSSYARNVKNNATSTQNSGLLTKIWSSVFGNEEKSKKNSATPRKRNDRDKRQSNTRRRRPHSGNPKNRGNVAKEDNSNNNHGNDHHASRDSHNTAQGGNHEEKNYNQEKTHTRGHHTRRRNNRRIKHTQPTHNESNLSQFNDD